MEPNQQNPMTANPNREGASNIQEAKFTTEDNQLLTSHRIFPGLEYASVYLSPGFGFRPKDDELITSFLNKKIDGEEAPYIFFPTVNVYGHSPKELAELHPSLEPDEWFFFSPRERKYMNGLRPSRSAGNGYWKATGADKKIYDSNDECVGTRKCLVFYEGKAPSGNKTNWVMHEYVAGDQRPRQPRGPGDMLLDDCVLCRIYKKSDCSPKREKQSTAGETEKSAAHKSSENENPAETEHEATNQHHHQHPVLQPNPGRLNLGNVFPTPPPPQHLQAIQHISPGYRLNSVPQDTKQIHLDNIQNSHVNFSDPTYMLQFGQLAPFPDNNFNYFHNNPSWDLLSLDPPFDDKHHPPDGQ